MKKAMLPIISAIISLVTICLYVGILFVNGILFSSEQQPIIVFISGVTVFSILANMVSYWSLIEQTTLDSKEIVERNDEYDDYVTENIKDTYDFELVINEQYNASKRKQHKEQLLKEMLSKNLLLKIYNNRINRLLPKIKFIEITKHYRNKEKVLARLRARKQELEYKKEMREQILNMRSSTKSIRYKRVSPQSIFSRNNDTQHFAHGINKLGRHKSVFMISRLLFSGVTTFFPILFIFSINGAVGGLAVGAYTGILALIPDGTNNAGLVFDGDGMARVGDVGTDIASPVYTSTQALATREDSPNSFGIPFWNATYYRFDTNPNVIGSAEDKDNVPLTINAITGQLANLLDLKVAGTLKFEINKDGNLLQNTAPLLTRTSNEITLGDSSTTKTLLKGNVGIGTSSPSTALDVVGSVRSSNYFIGTNTAHTYMNIANGADNYDVAFYTRTSTGATSKRLTISGGTDTGNVLISNANVGIGETTPTAQLQVKSSATTKVPLIVDSPSGQTALLQEWKVNGNSQAYIDADGGVRTPSIKNISTTNNSLISVASTGTTISRNIADANPALIINEAQGTGNIVNFQFGGSTKSSITKDGVFDSDVAVGTAPFSITSTTKVDNLNADLLDGYHASSFALATELETTLLDVESGESVIALPSSTRDGGAELKLEGVTLQATNKFNLTTTTTNGVTATVSGNQITLSGTATAETTFTLASDLTATNKAYVNVDYVSGTSNAVITLYNHLTSLNATYNTDYSNVVTLGTTTITIVITNGAVISSLIYKVNIDIVTTLIANKQYSPIYDTTFDLMSDAQIKAQMDYWVADGTLPNDDIQNVSGYKRITNVGKNLFDGELELGSISTTTGLSQSSSTAIRNIDYTKVKSSTVYVSNYDRWYLYDSNYNFISTGTTASFTTTSTTYYVRGIKISTDLNYAIQLELGSTATTYEPYQSSELLLNTTKKLNSLPNGTKDTIEYRDGKYYHIQRVQEYTLVSGDITAFIENELDGFNRISITKPINSSGSGNFSIGWLYINGASIWASPTLNHSFNVSLHATIIRYYNNDYLDLTAAKTALAGTEILYQLATPIETEIDTDGVLQVYEDGSVYVEDGDTDYPSLVPHTTLSVPISIATQLITNVESIKQLGLKEEVLETLTGIITTDGNIKDGNGETGDDGTFLAMDGTEMRWKDETTYTIATGTENGKIKVTPSNDDAYEISVYGLGSAAYTDSTAYATSDHTQAVNKGGTNLTSYTAGDILYASGTTTLTKIGIGDEDEILQVVSGVPAWTTKSGTYAGPTETLLGSRATNGTLSVTDIDTYDEIILDLGDPSNGYGNNRSTFKVQSSADYLYNVNTFTNEDSKIVSVLLARDSAGTTLTATFYNQSSTGLTLYVYGRNW